MSGLTRIEMDTMRAIENMNRKMKDQREIDWEQRRYEIAKVCMANGLISQYTPEDADVKLLAQIGTRRCFMC